MTTKKQPRSYRDGKLPLSNTNYKDMVKINARINKRMADITEKRWECANCHSNNFLPMEFGCDKCQPFKQGALLLGRIYK